MAQLIHALFFTLVLALLPPAAHAAAPPLASHIVRSAERFLEEQPQLGSRTCTGLASAILADAGVDLRGGVSHMWAQLDEAGRTHHRPPGKPGDLAFFDNTYDGNGNGRVDDKRSHVAVIISVDGDGTVHMVHFGSGAINPLVMNLSQPDVHVQDGKLLNSWLAQPGYGPDDARLAGQLWSGFGTPGGPGAAIASRTTGARGGAGRPLPEVDDDDDGKKAEGVATVPITAHPTSATAGRALARLHAGRKLRNRHLRGLDCEDLWFLRNAVFARHGYAFVTQKAQATFADQLWYVRDDAVVRNTVGARMTANDQHNVALILAAEEGCGGE